MPSPKGLSKMSPKSAKSGPNNKIQSSGSKECMIPRIRYTTMGTIFKKVTPNISVYIDRLHTYEVWNTLPQLVPTAQTEQLNSSKRSPKKDSKLKKSPSSEKSPKLSPKQKISPIKVQEVEAEVSRSELEPATIKGLVVVRKACLKNGEKVYVEITADFKYRARSRVPPFPDEVVTEYRCYRHVIMISYRRFDEDYSDLYSQTLFRKLKDHHPHGVQIYPFTFNLTGTPDSFFFRRPYYYDYQDGLFWHLRAYIANAEHCEPVPERQVGLDFFKYTIAPTLTPSNPRPGCPIEYKRHCTTDDTGDLRLEAELERDTYYHGQDIKVKIRIDNESKRHVVHSMSIFVEQTCRLHHQLPQDIISCMGEVSLGPSDIGLPINPKQKPWTKEVLIKPEIDSKMYDLAIDGKMPNDEKVFPASSTILVVSQSRPSIPKDQSIDKTDEVNLRASPGKKPSPGSGKSSPSKKSNKKSPSKKPKQGHPQSEDRQPGQTPTTQVPAEVKIMTDRQTCRPVFISYSVVVRLNLRTASGDESGHPMVRVPFILTRESRYLDRLSNVPPPTWTSIQQH